MHYCYDLKFNLINQLRKHCQEINLIFLINVSKHKDTRDTKNTLNIFIKINIKTNYINILNKTIK